MRTGDEKRKHRRIRRNFIVRLKPKPPAGEEISSRWESVNVQDIGAGGALFYYHRDLPLGTILDFEICFIPYKSKISCVGRIVRVDRPPASVITRIAVEFAELSGKDKKVIDKAAARCGR